MGIVSAIVVYLITWWTVLFMVLPWGVRPSENPQPGHAPSAPERPMLVRKFIITTLISAVIFAVVYLVVDAEIFSFRDWVAGEFEE
ncbi:MAG: DUF1467 family protein [Azospirillaceae bacterium]